MASSSTDTKDNKDVRVKQYEISSQGIDFISQHAPWLQGYKAKENWKTIIDNLNSNESELKDAMYAQFLNVIRLETEIDRILKCLKKDEMLPTETKKSTQSVNLRLPSMIDRAIKAGHITEKIFDACISK